MACANAGSYDVVVTNSVSVVTSAVAVLTVTSATSTNGATLVTNSTYVFYLPPASNPNVEDRFTYTISDGWLSATGTVVVTIADPAGQSQNLVIGLDGANHPRLTIFGIPGYQYDIQRGASTTGPWTTKHTCTLPSSGPSIGKYEWADAEVTGDSYFYRTKLH